MIRSSLLTILAAALTISAAIAQNVTPQNPAGLPLEPDDAEKLYRAVKACTQHPYNAELSPQASYQQQGWECCVAILGNSGATLADRAAGAGAAGAVWTAKTCFATPDYTGYQKR